MYKDIPVYVGDEGCKELGGLPNFSAGMPLPGLSSNSLSNKKEQNI
ncbi:MAG: hypothetical protein C5S47_03325 [Candidatus Methanogasteraceae archaeon]|nr:MAG: hypothetical protein C5S47_03325 [ANME-2 cluster archaeon]